MTSETTTVSERVERARSQDMEMTLVDTDPVVVQVFNEESDRIHTVVPQSVHCSCEDHTYRGYICKHIIALLGTDGHVGDVMRGYLKEHRAGLESEANEVRERLDDILFQCEQITAVLNELDIDQDLERTDEDGMTLLQEGVEERDAAIVDDEVAVDQTDAEDRDEFTEMVENLTGGGAQ